MSNIPFFSEEVKLFDKIKYKGKPINDYKYLYGVQGVI